MMSLSSVHLYDDPRLSDFEIHMLARAQTQSVLKIACRDGQRKIRDPAVRTVPYLIYQGLLSWYVDRTACRTGAKQINVC